MTSGRRHEFKHGEWEKHRSEPDLPNREEQVVGWFLRPFMFHEHGILVCKYCVTDRTGQVYLVSFPIFFV